MNRDSDGVSYVPVIRYRGTDGIVAEGVTHIGSSEYDYRIGAPVDILYAPDDRGVVRINSFFSLYGMGLIFTFVSVVFLTLLTFALRFMSRASDRFGGSFLARQEAEARRRWAREGAEASAPATPDPAPADRYGYGHRHEPKPKPEPTVRRNR